MAVLNGAKAGLCVVQGASKGIGIAYVKHFLASFPSISVVATSRTPQKAQELVQLQLQFGTSRLHLVPVDITNDKSIEEAGERIDSISKEGSYEGVQCLINSTGILHPSGRGETSLAQVSRQGLIDVMNVNAFGSLLFTKQLSPLLIQKKTLTSELFPQAFAYGNTTGVIVNLSARVGSIGDNQGMGGWYAYRMSKCALNMATKTLAIELGRRKTQQVIVISLHPSTVMTDFSKAYWKGKEKNTKNLLTPEKSVSNMMSNVIQKLTPDKSGMFFDYAGQQVPY
jgi:NAD(P)-dependent dehydrogenase (short-subunit alcohol dehydrogenase family)